MRAAKGGESDAQFNLGAAYLLGQGIKKDLKAGADWLKKAADQGNLNAQLMLLRMEN